VKNLHKSVFKDEGKNIPTEKEKEKKLTHSSEKKKKSSHLS
jgi:hypothetical protein